MTDKEVLNPLRRSLRKALLTATKRAARKLAHLQDDLRECARAEYFMQNGEIIKANLAQIKRGCESIELPDMFSPGKTRVIEMDVHLKPMENARKYFKRSRKLSAGAETKASQIEKCEIELSALQDLCASYAKWEEEAVPELPPSDEFVQGAADCRVHIEGLQPVIAEKGKLPPRGVREFKSMHGDKILVGKNARDNDYLSFRIARGNDWWFHAAHVSGSHVVVKQKSAPKKSHPLDQDTMLDAAHLAVYYSKMRHATRADVTYAQAKNIRKGKRSPAGQVTVNNGQTLALRIEEKRLRRLLEGDAGEY